MNVHLPFDKQSISIRLPETTTVLHTTYPEVSESAEHLAQDAMQHPISSPGFVDVLKQRRPGQVVIVVSDITRPLPYSAFLPQVLQEIENAGVPRDELLILIATGMHRPSTPAERVEILGQEICARYHVQDHNPDADLVELPTKSWSGNSVWLNRDFVNAGFRFIAGLVEPHYMAGFSGGRKAVCPGLASLDTVRRFHGYEFLANPNTDAGQLDDNPCHLEALSVASAVGVDFSLNVVLNHSRQIIKAFAGQLEDAHLHACQYVQQHAVPAVEHEFDVVLTSSAGYPLDATFYQCTKSLVTALPAVKSDGHIVSIGGCCEGIGSQEYENILLNYSDSSDLFIKDISKTETVIKDQWQHQMHVRALIKLGRENLMFITNAIKSDVLNKLSVNGMSTSDVQQTAQSLIDRAVADGKSICVIPEGPYCTPRAIKKGVCV